MAEFGFDLEAIARLIRLVETRGLTELIVEEGDCRIVVRGILDTPPPSPTEQIAPFPAHHHPPSSVSDSPAPLPDNANRVAISSPMIGVFYRSPGPDQPPFVDLGDHVEVGQTIGLIEAMKVFTEVPSEVAGIVVEICVKDGQLVHPDDPLMYLLVSS